MDFIALSEAQRQHFDTYGYIAIPQALDPHTVERLVEVGDRFMASAGPVHNYYANRYIDLLYDELLTELSVCSATVPLVIPLHFVEPSLRAGDAYLFSTSTNHTPAVNFTKEAAKGLLVSYAYNW